MAVLVVGEEVCGDEWMAVVRREDVRVAGGKEGVVCGEGFRVGDLVRGVVVGFFFFFFWEMGWIMAADDESFCRSVWGTSRITTCLPPVTSSVSSWRGARRGIQWFLSAGKNFGIR